MSEFLPATLNDYKYSHRSELELSTCHKDLQRVFRHVLHYKDHTILEGKRALERQQMLVGQGASKTLKSKHVTGDKPSLAVDVVPYPFDWYKLDHTRQRGDLYIFAGVVFTVADTFGISLRWGGDWDRDGDFTDQTFDDLVHWELHDG